MPTGQNQMVWGLVALTWEREEGETEIDLVSCKEQPVPWGLKRWHMVNPGSSPYLSWFRLKWHLRWVKEPLHQAVYYANEGFFYFTWDAENCPTLLMKNTFKNIGVFTGQENHFLPHSAGFSIHNTVNQGTKELPCIAVNWALHFKWKSS